MVMVLMRIILAAGTCVLFATETKAVNFVDVMIGPEEAVMKSSVKYSVIGTYQAEFNHYSGEIRIDEKTNEIQSVHLSIDAASIQSNCSWCDNIVRSGRLLSVEEFPDIVFRSDKIMKGGDGYRVNGTLRLHGQTRTVNFPFTVRRAGGFLDMAGQWIINRKEFNITWSRLLDKGGVLVGNEIIIDWKIRMPIVH